MLHHLTNNQLFMKKYNMNELLFINIIFISCVGDHGIGGIRCTLREINKLQESNCQTSSHFGVIHPFLIELFLTLFYIIIMVKNDDKK